MNLADLVLIFGAIFIALGAMASILLIGKEREPITPGTALGSVLFAILLDGAIIVALLR
jgi:hypothetical protein